jgi:hypothetical protein
MKKPSRHLIAEVPRRPSRVEMTIGIDLGDVWNHYCTLNEEGEAVDRGRFRTGPKGVEKWFTDLPQARIAMEVGTHSIWISEPLQELGHEVIVANVRELRAISHDDPKSDQVDAGSWLASRGLIRRSYRLGKGPSGILFRLHSHGRRPIDSKDLHYSTVDGRPPIAEVYACTIGRGDATVP